jgi:hypothetical protein
MAAILDERYQEIAAWLNAAFANNKKSFASASEVVGLAKKFGYIVGADAFANIGLTELVGIATAQSALLQLVKKGKVTQQEAALFLAEKYADVKWGLAQWGDQASSKAKQAASNSLATAPLLGPQTFADVQKLSATIQQAQPDVQAITKLSPIILDALPDQPTGNDIQLILESLTKQITAAIGQVASKTSWAANSIPGTAIIPGTLPPSAINPKKLAEFVSRLPGPDDAIVLNIAPSQSMDRNYVGVAAPYNKGPGRVWTVTGVASYPANFQPKSGPTRYRIASAGQKFSVMSMRMSPTNNFGANALPLIETRYGMLLSGIPHWFGRPPVAIMVLSSGDQPTSLASFTDYGGGSATHFPGTNKLFHTRADKTYRQVTFPSFTAFGSGPGGGQQLVPASTDWRECTGFEVALVSGMDDEAVYQQLNTLDCVGQTISRECVGPNATYPPGNVAACAAPPSLYAWDGSVGSGFVLNFQDQTNTLVAAVGNNLQHRIAQGVPFRYEDCAKLVANSSTFAVVVQPGFTRSASMLTAGNYWSGLEDWGTVGVKLDGTSPRDWGIDIIVM